MGATDNIPDLERVAFFSGQRLQATDLTDMERAHREMRWLHNRSLHAWGIGTGLDAHGEPGESAVRVMPGYAIDCLGREIILTKTVSKPVPAVPGAITGGDASYYLVAVYQEDADQEVAEARPGVCHPPGTVRLTETPALEWRSATEFVPDTGYAVVLAQAWIRNCRLSRPLSWAVRRYARPAHQPYIAVGQSTPGDSTWESAHVGTAVSMKVDTSIAKFSRVPSYFAHVVGSRVCTQQSLIHATPVTVDPTSDGFTMLMIIESEDLGGQDLLNCINDELGWTVVWMGIEG